MRCPNCNKFVSLETQDPCCDEIDIEFSKTAADDGTFTVTASGTTDRNCADCGDLMKQVSWDMEAEIELSDVKGFDELEDEAKKTLVEAIELGTAEHKVEEQGTSAEESGGGRYKKNIITSTVEYFVEINYGELKLTQAGNMSVENAASEFEEQC